MSEFKSLGKGCNISDWARFYNACKISIGDNVRIDDFCVISGNVEIGNHVHIACGVYLFGKAGIKIEDFAQLSVRTCILSQTDDFSGMYLPAPVFPDKYRGPLKSGLVTLSKHVTIGANSTIMPGVFIGEGVAIGAYSFVKKDCIPWSTYMGIPAKRVGERKKGMLELEKQFLTEWSK